MKIDENLHYSKQHMWVKAAGDGSYMTGITDYAQDLLGDIVFVDIPPAGTQLIAGLPCGLVESVKTGSDLHAPLTGRVTATNTSLASNPEQINDTPYLSWIFKFEPLDADEINSLLSASQYQALIQAQA